MELKAIEKAQARSEPTRWMAAIRTGLRRTDERTGRTVELIVCSELRETDYAPNASIDTNGGFFVEELATDTKRVRCRRCRAQHRVIDPFAAIVEGRISGEDGTDISTIAIPSAVFIEGDGDRETEPEKGESNVTRKKKIEKKLPPAVARAFEPPPREPQRAERQRSSASGRRQVLRAARAGVRTSARDLDAISQAGRRRMSLFGARKPAARRRLRATGEARSSTLLLTGLHLAKMDALDGFVSAFDGFRLLRADLLRRKILDPLRRFLRLRRGHFFLPFQAGL